jgi:hypothetical protein
VLQSESLHHNTPRFAETVAHAPALLANRKDRP